jgi:hypothetical protein
MNQKAGSNCFAGTKKGLFSSFSFPEICSEFERRRVIENFRKSVGGFGGDEFAIIRLERLGSLILTLKFIFF